MRTSTTRINVVAGLCGLVAVAWSSAAAAQECATELCITWTSPQGWDGTFTGNEPTNGGVGGGGISDDDEGHVHPVETNSIGAMRGDQAVQNLSISPPPPSSFPAVTADISNQGTAIGTGLEPTADATPNGRNVTVTVAPTVPPCARGPNPSCSFGGNSPVPVPTGPTTHPNLGDNKGAVKPSDPVNPANGEFVTQYSDLSLPGFGVPFNHVRTYRSRLDYDGPLGFGWEHSYDQRIIPGDPNQCSQGVLYSPGDGTIIRFETTATSTLVAPDGVHLKLERTGGGWTLTRPEGIVSIFTEFDGAGLLTSIRDLNGTGLSFTWTKTDPGQQWRLTGATDSAGRSIVYQYYPDGHLHSVSSGVLSATYDYQGNNLRHVVRADNAEETYEYRSGFPDNDSGDPIPIGQVPAACAQACSANPGCGAVDPCATIVGAARASCHAGCTTCNAACGAQCPQLAQDACQPGISTCRQGCEAQACTNEILQKICQDAFVGRNATGDGPRPVEYCLKCRDTARMECGSYCAPFDQCAFAADGSGLLAEGIMLYETGGNKLAATAAGVAAWLAVFIPCVKKDGLDFDTLERLAEHYILALNTAPSLVGDTAKCVGTAVGGVVCGAINFVHDTCHVDVDCDYSSTLNAISLACQDNCFQCNAFGQRCGDGSCNATNNCFEDCKDRFYGVKSPGSCPEYREGGGCPAKALTQCQNQCQAACDQNCVADSTTECVRACQVGCAPGGSPPGQFCDAGCDAIDLAGQCRGGCEETCIAANSNPSGTLRYGGLRDLNHNLTKVTDGTGREVVVNTYGENPNDPSFDSVISQQNGDFTVAFHYRDLGAEQRGLRAAPTSQDDLQGYFPSVDVPTICADNCTLGADGMTCVRGNPQGFRQYKAERATRVSDTFYGTRTYYIGSQGEILARHEVSDNYFWSFNYEGGQMSAAQGPAGDHQCVKHDANGNVIEIAQFPTIGSTSDNGDAFRTATPRVSRWAYQSSPSRPTTVFDPRHPLVPLETFLWDDKGNLIRAEDGNFNPTTFVPTAFGPPDTSTLPDGSVTKFVYDEGAGVLKSVIKDSLGPTPVTISLSPDALGRPSVGTGPLGETTMWQWNGANIASVTKHANGFPDEATSFSVDVNGRVYNANNGQLSVTQTFDRLGYVQSSVAVSQDASAPTRRTCSYHGPDGRLIEQVLPRGNHVAYSYDRQGHMNGVFKGFFSSAAATWDDDCVTVPDGASFQLWSGMFGRDGTLDRFTDAQGATTFVLAKTGFGEPAVIQEPNGRVTHRGYDQMGHLIWQAVYACGFDQPCVVLPQYGKPQYGAANLARMTEFSYDASGVLSATDAWHFDPLTGQPIGDGHSITQYVRNLANDTVKITDDNGNSVTHHTDRVGRPTQTDLPTGDVIKTEYADGGATVFQSWPTPAGLMAERVQLTPWGTPSERALLEGDAPLPLRLPRTIQTWTYDSHRRGTGGTQVGGPSLTIVNDAFGQPTSTTRDFGNGKQELVTQKFTDNGDLDTATSKAGLIPLDMPDTMVIVNRDALDRPFSVQRTDPSLFPLAMEQVDYAYEGATALIQQYTDSRRVQTVYTRWPGGQIRTATPTLLTQTLPLPPHSSRSFTYDGAGRMATGRALTVAGSGSTVLADETLFLGWDSMGNKTTERTSRLPGSGVTDTFDGAGHRVGSTLAGWGVSRIYDQIGRLKDLAVGTSAVHFDYIGLGRSARSDDNGAIVSSYGHDTFGRMASMTVTNQLGRVGKWTWSSPLDGVPRLATYTNQQGVSKTSAYEVDLGGRMVGELNGVDGDITPAFSASSSTIEANGAVDGLLLGFPSARTMQLDGRGNWQSRITADGSATIVTQRNSLDQYTSFNGAAVHYDGDKLTSIDGFNGTEYQYDGFGQLISAGRSPSLTTYTYDALGRLSSRSAPNLAAPGTIVDQYGYDGAERVVRAGTTTSVVIDGDGQDEHLLRIAGSVQHIHQDRLGSVFLVTDQTGRVLEQYAYTAYGERTITNPDGITLADSAIGNDFGFQGQRQDAVSGLIEMRYRWYRPDWGRFLTADPLGYLGGSNFYAFVGGAPLTYLDPFGLAAVQSNWAQSMTWSYWNNHFQGYFYQLTGPNQSLGTRASGLVGAALSSPFAITEDIVNVPSVLIGNGIDQATLRGAADEAFANGNTPLGQQLTRQADRQSDVAGNQLARGFTEAGAVTGIAGMTLAATAEAGAAITTETAAMTAVPQLAPRVEGEADHIALGLEQVVEANASSVGARTLMGAENWKQAFRTAMDNGKTKFTVFLDQMNLELQGAARTVESVVNRSILRNATARGGATDWEITQLYKAGLLKDVIFIEKGVVQNNPFK